MDILDDMGVSKLSPNVFFFKVNYSFKSQTHTNYMSHGIPCFWTFIMLMPCFLQMVSE